MDGLVTGIMKDPTEFSRDYIKVCPAGAAAFAGAAAMLALMSNPSLFERFANLAHYIVKGHVEAVLQGAAMWGIFHAFAKLSVFATRSFDLVWSTRELLSLPDDSHGFDRLRLDPVLRDARLASAASAHAHSPTRELAAFLLTTARRQAGLPSARREVFVYLTAVGGPPFADHIAAFITRAMVVRLPALIIACMDRDAHLNCKAAATDERAELVHCVAAFDGHVVLIKHAFIPVLLSAAVDTVWIDFDTFLVRDPTDSIVKARDEPEQILPRRSRIRFGSFLFDNATDICSLSKICDNRMMWAWNVSGVPDEQEDRGGDVASRGVELLVTEHWDARCLNNGLFYVRATHRPLQMFTVFLSQLYNNPYTDNQNLFDAFLAHSTLDSAAPDARPILRYALLDIHRTFACAEGHMGNISSLVSFHFWSSDFKTREVAKGQEEDSGVSVVHTSGSESVRATIKTREGVEREAKTTATKADLFDMFLGPSATAGDGEAPLAGARFIEQVRYGAPPNWKGMCAVTAVGIEDLLDEKMLQNDQALPDWVGVSKSLDHLEEAKAAENADATEVVPQPLQEIPLKDWVAALQRVAELEDNGLLKAGVATPLKARLRRQDVGYLMTIQAYHSYSWERLASELQEAIAADE